MCKNQAEYRYTWPGRNETLICTKHAEKLKAVANAIGLHLQMIPLSQKYLEMKLTCTQKEG